MPVRVVIGAVAQVASVLLATSACTGTTPAIPLPGTDEDSANRQMAVLDPCTLLTQTELDQAGLRTTRRDTDARGSSCGWSRADDTNGKGGFSVEVVLNTRSGLDDLGNSDLVITDDPIGKHSAKQGRNTDETVVSSCFVIIEVTGSSRVDLNVLTGPGGACELANQFARKVEPRLPGGSR